MPISTAPLERVASQRTTSLAIARRTDTGLATGTLLLLTLAALAVPGLVRASPDASALHGENCVSCHGTELYTREDRRVQSPEALATQVRMCEQNLGLTWFDDDVDAVTRLLNQKYYQFD